MIMDLFTDVSTVFSGKISENDGETLAAMIKKLSNRTFEKITEIAKTSLSTSANCLDDAPALILVTNEGRYLFIALS